MYIPGRYISECTSNTFDLFSYAKENNLPGMLLVVNFERAFDSVDLSFILITLEIFGIGGEFIKWITIILGIKEGTNFKAVTVVDGNISSPSDMKQGCRQCNLISSYLFFLAHEILSLL